MNNDAAQFLIQQNNETIHFLIEQKITFLNAVVGVCMLWWVSSIVFYGSVLAAVWLKKDELKKEQNLVTLLGRFLSGFFLATAFFGVVILLYSIPIQKEIAALAARLENGGDFFYYEIWGFRIAMLFGTGSFFIIFFIWRHYLRHLRGEIEKENQRTESKRANQSETKRESQQPPP